MDEQKLKDILAKVASEREGISHEEWLKAKIEKLEVALQKLISEEAMWTEKDGEEKVKAVIDLMRNNIAALRSKLPASS